METERLTDGTVIIDGKHYRLMTDEECADFVWGTGPDKAAEQIAEPDGPVWPDECINCPELYDLCHRCSVYRAAA